MNWGSWEEFAHMGGYGFYVWGSWGAVVLGIAIEVIALRRRLRRARRR
jgi:heme exporter protein D